MPSTDPPVARRPEAWSLRCLMCGALAGQLLGAVFTHNPSCEILPPGGARRRCCRCGGSLLREPGTWETQSERVSDAPAIPTPGRPLPNVRTKWG